jgi:hypothetical protein
LRPRPPPLRRRHPVVGEWSRFLRTKESMVYEEAWDSCNFWPILKIWSVLHLSMISFPFDRDSCARMVAGGARSSVFLLLCPSVSLSVRMSSSFCLIPGSLAHACSYLRVTLCVLGRRATVCLTFRNLSLLSHKVAQARLSLCCSVSEVPYQCGRRVACYGSAR